MVAPLLAAAAPAIVQGITGLLGGIFSGKQKSNERKWAQEDRQTKINDAEMLRPDLPRVNIESGLGPFAEMINRLMVGNASRYLGDSATAGGLDFSKILASLPNMLGGGQPQQSAQPGYANNILRKYGMEERGFPMRGMDGAGGRPGPSNWS